MKKKPRRWTKVTIYFLLFSFFTSLIVYTTVWMKYDQPLTYMLSGSYQNISELRILTEITNETQNQGYLFLNPQKVEQRLNKTQFFKTVHVRKNEYRVIDIFVEEKNIVMKQLGQGNTILFDEKGQSFSTDIPTNVPVIDSMIKSEDISTIADSLGAQSRVLLQQLSEITYSYVGEARTEIKIITVQGDIIFVKLNDLKKKLPLFLEIDTIMNQKNIMKCEYHFEYNNGSVVVNEMK
ncbi:MAG: cell division protein FtsQ/DivIB [Culicoidibacterales bacterium]